jgi:hypothetical protein
LGHLQQEKIQVPEKKVADLSGALSHRPLQFGFTQDLAGTSLVYQEAQLECLSWPTLPLEEKLRLAGMGQEVKTKLPKDVLGLFNQAVSDFGVFPEIAGRLTFFKEKWFQVDPYVASEYIDGVRLYWKDKPPPVPRTLFQPRVEDEEILDDLFLDCAKKNLLQVVTFPGISSPTFYVKKSTGGWRPIWDLRFLNSFCTPPPRFKMEGLSVVKQLARPTDVGVTVDLHSAYQHVAMHHSTFPYMLMQWRATSCLYRVLPFGLAWAPFIWTSIMKPLAGIIRSRSIRVVFYIDDILIMAPPSKIVVHRDFVLRLFMHMGLLISWKKSALVPSAEPLFLGTVIDFKGSCFRVPESKLAAYKSSVRQMWLAAKQGKQVHVRELASVLGKLQSLSQMVLLTRAHTTHLWLALGLMTRTHTTKSVLPAEAVEELYFWQNVTQAWNKGKAFFPLPFDKTVSTDSSDKAYGGGTFTKEGKWDGFSRTWPLDMAQSLHINLKEMLACVDVVLSLVKKYQWRDLCLRVLVDNMVCLWYLQKQGGKKDLLAKAAASLHLELAKRNITLTTQYVPSKENSWADFESRRELSGSDRMVHPAVFKQLQDLFCYRVQMDAFASKFNKQVDQYISRFADHLAQGVDFFSMASTLRGWKLWANPPFAMLGAVIESVRLNKLSMMLCIPWWPARPWFSLLAPMLATAPVVLPVRPDLYLQRALTTVGSNPRLQTHPAWLSLVVVLDGSLTNQDFSKSRGSQVQPPAWYTQFCALTREEQIKTLVRLQSDTSKMQPFSRQLQHICDWLQVGSL